ncbi:hypothetical protein ACQZV8_04310 [Magnetococcales bacterium HHB-1]
MKIYFENTTTEIPELYTGYDDVPGLHLTLHLHGWTFEDQTGAGEAKMRLEVREESRLDQPAVAVGFVIVTPAAVKGCQAFAPLAQSILDGLLTHEVIQKFLIQAAEKALYIPMPEKSIASEGDVPARKKRMMEKAFYNPKLHH